jgi:hypothetical protein
MSADVTIAVLTGKRPALLEATLAALVTNQPELYAAAAKVVIHNTGDPETAEVLDRYVWDERVVLKGKLRGIAEASQHLIKAAALADRRHVLRLEDDWLVSSRPFYAEAAALLEDPELNVGQIRLRDASETVMVKHRVTKKPMIWRELDNGHLWAPSAHYTHNPSLMRTWDYAAMAGYTDEIDAARRFFEAGWSTVQHVPGAFVHAGDKNRGLSLKWSVGSS